MTTAVTQMLDAPYYYLPIHFYNSQILKCKGLATPANLTWMMRDNPDIVILPRYMGDRITADTHELFVE